MKEVYLVIYHDIYDYDLCESIFIYDSYNKARKKFEELKELKKDYVCDTRDEGEDFFDYYDEGWSSRDCIYCRIEKRTVA